MILYHILADAVVAVHAAFICVVVLGLVGILVGIALRWRWVRNFWFRAVHFLMIAVVVGQALLGIVCPLTTLENYLRKLGGEEPYPGSFIGYWAHELIFYDGPPWAFTLGYCIFGAAVLVTLLAAPPRWPWRKSPPTRDATAGG